MAHKTLIGGTAYEISGGKPLVNGTAYSIDKGKTLVGGTAYEVGFGPPPATITITEGPGSTAACIEIDGVTYNSPTTVSVPVGTVVKCYAYAANTYGYAAGGYIYLSETGNSTNVETNRKAGAYATYEYTVSGDVSIKLTTSSTPGGTCGYVYIY